MSLTRESWEGLTTPWSSIGYLTYKRTYSRKMPDVEIDGYIKANITEEFNDTIRRELDACETQLKCGFTYDERQRLGKYLKTLKGSTAGRFMWQLGSKTVDRLGMASLMNCCFCVVDEPVRPFTWIMDNLMLGSGVGFNMQRKNVDQLPSVKDDFSPPTVQNDAGADYIVPDTREGWVKLLGKVLKAAFLAHETGKQTFTYSTQLIRPFGTPIDGFGGVASGPAILVDGISRISHILCKRRGQKLRATDVLDIVCIIASIVVAGNVRRSALISIGDCDDIDYLMAKRWDLGHIPDWRSNVNCSVVCDDFATLPPEFWEGYKGNGEPYGLINLRLSRLVGRLGDTRYPDPHIEGYNPCQPGFATVLTPEGIRTFDDIQIGSKIWSREGWTTVIDKWSTGVKPVYAYGSSSVDGVRFVGTENHKIECKSEWHEADLSYYRVCKDGFWKSEVSDIFFNSRKARLCPMPSEDHSLADMTTKLDSQVYLGDYEVFDITVDNNSHTYWTGGLSVSNCAEQGLENKETCALGELFLPNITSRPELIDVVKLLYRVIKHAMTLGCHNKETESVVHKNYRMGIGLTGVLEATDEQLEWAASIYDEMREYDLWYSKEHGLPPSIKLFTVKPSGTLSLLPGVTPGAHPAYAKFMIRRIRIASDHPLVEQCRKSGYKVEYRRRFDKTEDKGTVVVEFPFRHRDDAKLAKDMSAIDQLEVIRWLQTNWSDNSVSCTVYYRLEELDELREYLTRNYNDNFKTLSFMLHSGHGFDQAPLEEISQEQYEKMVADTIPINKIDEAMIGLGEECAGGMCPVR